MGSAGTRAATAAAVAGRYGSNARWHLLLPLADDQGRLGLPGGVLLRQGGRMGVFEFRHVWHLPVDVAVAYTALADVDSYPRWWPQVRAIERVDERSGHAFVRSLLPYTLDLLLTREVEDAAQRLLRVRIEGDLAGWSEWRLVAGPGTPRRSTIALYTQEATVTVAGFGRLGPVAAPVLRANHTWMMWSGERGLRDYLRG